MLTHENIVDAGAGAGAGIGTGTGTGIGAGAVQTGRQPVTSVN